ncbi:MAG: S8 family serine peptidase [Planctomycetes bacterium]|nr:S8 family serine peptidase [Planctomycetota bacterium]
MTSRTRLSAIAGALVSLTFLSSIATSQDSSLTTLAQPVFTGTPLAGAKPGTERWIVHFKERSFTLDAFRTEMLGRRDPETIAAIVQELDKKMRADQAAFVRQVEALGGSVFAQWWIVNACAIELTPKSLAAIRAMQNVAFLEPDVATQPCILTATNAANHNSDYLNSIGVTGNGVACGIVDTGQDIDMNGTGVPHITYSRRGTSTSRLVLNRQIGTQSADDVHGHGTGVASVAAGWRWNTTTADNGHAYDANIAGYSIANSTTGGSSTSTMASAWNQMAIDAAAYNIVAANLSYTGSPNPLSVEQKAVDSAALNADILACTAAGNGGTSVASSQINVNGLSVGAVNENSHTLAGFSSRGTPDNQLFPDICANGVSTNMARRNNESADYVASGTSMASPMVCGAATLIRGANRSLTSYETKAILLASTEASPGTAGTQVSTGPGCGYLQDDVAYTLATNSRRHGRASIASTTAAWTKTMAVTASTQYQVAIAWHRLDVNSSTWSNLDLRILNGTTVVAQSNTLRNTEEFVRFTAPSTGNYTIEVRATSLAVASQTFAWATSANTGLPGSYTLLGSACTAGTTYNAVPSAFASTFGNSNNYFGVGRHNMRYQQLFDRNEFTSNVAISGMAYREKTYSSPGGTTSATIKLGYSSRTMTTMNSNFDSNFDWTPTTVFNGNLNLPAWTGSNTNPSNFSARWVFSSPFYFYKTLGRNLLLEIRNTATTSIYSFADAASGANTTRVYATSGSNATTGTVAANYGLIVRFEGRPIGTTPYMYASGVPTIGASYTLNVSQAKPNTTAILLIGNYNPQPWLGCTLYISSTSYQFATTSSTGTLSLVRSVANNTALIGTQYYEQFIILGTLNAPGYALTRAGRATIGG